MKDRQWLWAVPLLLVITWLGARGLDADTYWLDETWSLYSAGAAHFGPLSPAEIWTRTATEDHGGPGYHLALSAWGALVGWTPLAARASSLLFGLLALAWVYRLGRQMVSPLAGLGALALMGGSAFYIYFLHELRTYMLSVLLLAFTLWAYWRLMWQRGRPGWMLQIGLAAGTAGLLYTHYYLALILPVIGLYHLLLAPKGRRWWRVTLLMAAGGALFLPWVGVVLEAFGKFSAAEAGAAEPGLSLPALLERTAAFFSSGAVWLLLPLAALALFALRHHRRAAAAAWLWALAALAVLIAINEWTALIKPGRERYLLMAWPPLALLGGVGLAALSRSRLRLAAVPLLAAWLIAGASAVLDGGLMRDTDGAQALPWDALAGTLAAEAQPDDAAAVHITVYNWALEVQTAAYHLHGLPVTFTLLEALPERDLERAARDFVGEAGQVWLGVDKRLPPGPRLEAFKRGLDGLYAPCGPVFDLPRLRLERYRRFPPAAFDPAQTAIIRFGADIHLTYAAVSPPEALLLWSVGANVPPYTYSVGLHLLDAAGALVAQADYGLPAEPFACRQTALPLAGLPPGTYQLVAMVYDWATGDRLPGELAATGETGDRLPLAVIELDG